MASFFSSRFLLDDEALLIPLHFFLQFCASLHYFSSLHFFFFLFKLQDDLFHEISILSDYLHFLFCCLVRC